MPQSDLYGLGATLVFLLSGHVPAEMMKRRYVVEFQSHVNVSPALSRWLEKMLAVEPGDRFPSATSALNALKGPPPKTKRGFLRGRNLVAASALVTTAVAAAVVLELRAGAKASAHPESYPKLPPRVTDSFFPAPAHSGPKATLPTLKLMPTARLSEHPIEEHDYALAMELVDNYEGHHEQLDNALGAPARHSRQEPGLGACVLRPRERLLLAQKTLRRRRVQSRGKIAQKGLREYSEKAVQLDGSFADAHVVVELESPAPRKRASDVPRSHGPGL